MTEYRYVPEYFVESPEVWKLSLDEQLTLADHYKAKGGILSLLIFTTRDKKELRSFLEECFRKYSGTAEFLHILRGRLSRWFPDHLVFIRSDDVYFQTSTFLPMETVMKVIKTVAEKFGGKGDLSLFEYGDVEIMGFRVKVEKADGYIVINVFAGRPIQELIEIDFDSFLREYPNPIIPVDITKARPLVEALLEKVIIGKPLIDASRLINEIEGTLKEAEESEEVPKKETYQYEVHPYIPTKEYIFIHDHLIWSLIYELIEGKSVLGAKVDRVIQKSLGKLNRYYKGRGIFVVQTEGLTEGVLNRILLEVTEEVKPKYVDIVLEYPNFVIELSYEAVYGPNFFVQIDDKFFTDYPYIDLQFGSFAGKPGIITVNEELFFKAAEYLKVKPDFLEEVQKVISTILTKLKNEPKSVY